jgi:phage shock protein A
MAVDQHKMILRLRQELEGANSLEEKDRVIGELHKQLERHERFLKESDICTKQLENELDRVLEDNHTLKSKMMELKQEPMPAIAEQDVEQMRSIIEDFTRQSSEMLNALEVLEAECAELREQLKGGDADPAEVEKLKQQLATAQQALLNLQTQHIELEERYLDLKTASL